MLYMLHYWNVISWQLWRIEQSNAKFALKKRITRLVNINKYTIPTSTSYACTVHDVQGFSLSKAAVGTNFCKIL